MDLIGKTPYELMFNKPPDISRLRPFGCICYAVIPEELRHKQQPTAVKCRLIGYQDGITKGWKLLRESDWMLFTCNDVTFDEETTPTPLPDCDYEDTDQFIDNDGYSIDDVEMQEEESESQFSTDEPEQDNNIEGTNDNVSESNLDESFYDANSDVSIDELLASHAQFSATNDMDPDTIFCFQTAAAFDAPLTYKQAVNLVTTIFTMILAPINTF
jgi:hypothetical protein